MPLTFVRDEEEYPRVWRYSDPFVGSLDLRKVDLPDPPPSQVTVTIEWDGAGATGG